MRGRRVEFGERHRDQAHDCTEEQGDTTSRQDGGTISCQGNYMQLLEGDKSLRGPKVSSSPNSKGGLFTYLFVSKNTCTPDAAFQKSIELLKTLMTTGNVVLISSVFCQSEQLRKSPTQTRIIFHITTATLQEAMSAGPLITQFGRPSGQGVGWTPVDYSSQTTPWWEQRIEGSLAVPMKLILSHIQPQSFCVSSFPSSGFFH